jgi:RNA polymerase sigma-70 factor (ECF subfamily)
LCPSKAIEIFVKERQTRKNRNALNESELIGQLKRGDKEAFRTIVEKHKDQIYNTCLSFLHHSEDAEDTAQEVFIEVFESIGSFQEKSSLSTWIYRIATTKSLELIRKRNRKKRSGYFEALRNRNDEPDDIEDQSFFLPPGIALEQKEKAEILMKAINALPERQRIAFTLHKLENLPYKKIADIMEIHLSAVESLMHRAKKNLQQTLFSYYKGKNYDE